ncbi:PQQ-binding-like beta-propeller repeat protein (plasmid) [Haloarcula salina]|uniref:outer membrane protein assembly factor BamB family protein n=1 Tax=Haloarcula salina TaxID=1429914 RepID=UPI003C6F1B51
MNRRTFLRQAAVGVGLSSLVGMTPLNPLTPSNSNTDREADYPVQPTPEPVESTPTPEPLPDYVLWGAEVTGDPSGIAVGPSESDLFISLGSKVYQIDSKTGSVGWNAESEQTIERPVGISDDHVFATGRHGRLLAIDRATGERLWFKDTDSFSPDRPIVYQDSVIVAGQSVKAFGTSNGERRWTADVRFTTPRAIRSGEYLYLVDTRDTAKINLQDGATEWKWEEREYTDGPSYNVTINHQRNRLFGTNGSDLFAIDTETGELIWAGSDPGIFHSLSSHGDILAYHIITEEENSMLGAIDLAATEIKWENITSLDYSEWNYGQVSTELWNYQNSMLAGTETGHIVTVNPQSGGLQTATQVVDGPIQRLHITDDHGILVTERLIRAIELPTVLTSSSA